LKYEASYPVHVYLLTTAVADGSRSNSNSNSNSNNNNNNNNNNNKLPLVWHEVLQSESRGLTPAIRLTSTLILNNYLHNI
jgi:hypothetical protein